VLRAIEAQGKREAAHRCAQFAARVFHYAIQIGAMRGKVNPAADLRGALKPVNGGNHPGITDPATFGLLMRVLDSKADTLGYASVTYGLQLLARTALRSSELREALWREINFDKAEWRVPAERMKMKREHLIPLSTRTVALFKALHEISGDGELVFPGQHEAEVSDTALRKRLHMIFPPEMHSLHGFRTSFSTLMNERGFDSQLIELQLSHRKRDAVASIYDRSERIPERRKLMQDWSDYIDELRGYELPLTQLPAKRRARA
jgi:integrase